MAEEKPTNSGENSHRLLLTAKNWSAFHFKFKLAAQAGPNHWQYIDPFGQTSSTRSATAGRLAALIFLTERVCDKLIWIIANCEDPNDPVEAFKALQNEVGTSRKDMKTEIKRVEGIRMAGLNTSQFFSDVSHGINDLREIGVTKEQFGAREECDLLVSGLSEKFSALQISLISDLSRCTWTVSKSHSDVMAPEAIKKAIEAFKTRILLTKRHVNPNFEPKPKPSTNPPKPSREYANTTGSDACKFCEAMGGNAALKAHTHSTADCGFKKRSEQALAATVIDGTNKTAKHYLIADSGSTKDMHPDSAVLFDYKPFATPKTVLVGDGTPIHALGKGTMVVKSFIDGSVEYFPFFDTLHVPKLSQGLVSIPVLMRQHTKMDWNSDHVNFYQKGNIAMKAQLLPNNVLQITGTPIPAGPEADHILQQLNIDYARVTTFADSAVPSKFLTWHRRMGHPGRSTLLKTAKLVKGMDLGPETSMPPCEACAVANAKRCRHPSSSSKADKAGTLIHADHGIFSVPTIHGETAYLLTVDDHDHYCELDNVRTLTATETLKTFKKMEMRLENQHAREITSVKIIRTDDHGAFEGVFSDYLDSKGIRHQLSIRYEHEQMGTVERMHQTIGNKHRAQMTYADVPIELAGYSLKLAAYITNRTFTTTEDVTPYQKRTGLIPDVSKLRIFFSPAVVTIPKELQRKSLTRHGIRCRYLGPCEDQAGNWFIEVDTNRIISSNAFEIYEDWRSNPTIDIKDYHVSFTETEPSDDSYEESSTENLPHRPNPRPSYSFQDAALPAPKDICGPPTHSSRRPLPSSVENTRYVVAEDTTFLDEEDPYLAFQTAMKTDVPKNLKEAMSCPEWPQYRDAMTVELTAHHRNCTWKRLPRSKYLTRKRVRCRWVFDKKFNHDGSLNKYKARLVAMGFTQKHGLDYSETFAPTMALKSFRTLVAIACAQGYRLYHADVPTAFIRSTLKEEVYMTAPDIPPDVVLPPGFETLLPEDTVQLQKALYGLKQSSREWYATIRSFFISLGFVQSAADPCIYSLSKPEGVMTIGLYVDDLLYFGPGIVVDPVMKRLQSEYDITVLGLATHFLGIHIDQTAEDGSISLDQHQYISDFLSSFGLLDAYPVSTPLVPNYAKLLSEPCTEPYNPPLDVSYNQAVGKVMYAMVGTRPDICTAVGIVSRFLQNPNNTHWNLLMRILRYLNTTKNFKIVYTPDSTKTVPENLTPIVWTDADFANDPEKARSISGFGITLCGGPIIWYSKKQSTTAQSTAEAEFISANMCTRTVVWLRILLSSLHFPVPGPSVILEDNESCIAIAKNPQLNHKTAHFQVQYHFIQEKIEDGTIALQYCPTAHQVADLFTKGLPRLQFRHLLTLFGIHGLGGVLQPDTSVRDTTHEADKSAVKAPAARRI